MNTSYKYLPNRFVDAVVAIFVFTLATANFLGGSARAETEKSQFTTVAESSGYVVTSHSAQVARSVRRVTKSANQLNQMRFGRTIERRPLRTFVAADAPVSRAAELAADDRLVVFVLRNIHPVNAPAKKHYLHC